MKYHNHFKWLIQYARKSKKDLFFYCFIGILMVGVWLLLPIFISRQTLLLTGSSFDDLFHLAFLIFGIHFFYSFLKYFISYHAQRFITQTFRCLHMDMTKHFLNTKYEAIQKQNAGFYIERLTTDAIDIADFFINITDDLIDIFINIGSLITIFLLNRFLFFFYLYFLFVLFLIKKTKTKRYAEEEKKKRNCVETMINSNLEMIRGIKEIKLLNIKKWFQKKIDSDVKDFNDALMNTGEVERFFLFLSNNVRNVFRFLLISFAIYLISQERLTISVALLALNYENSIFKLIDYSESLIQHVRIFDLASKRIMEILDPFLSPLEKFGAKSLTSLSRDAVTSQDLSFSYQPEKEILSNVSFIIPHQSTTAFVGKSGSGKTTLFSLFCKLYEKKTGEIQIFGENINEIKEKELRSAISVVSQSPFFFSMSIYENLKLAKENATKEEIEKACKIAQIHEEIRKLPNGYNTKLFEGGTNLSGGQRQRLAIARALLRDTPVLLLDEATSALDNETQKRLLKEFKRFKNKTIITIAHRLSTIQDYEQIIVLKDGKIDAIGSHQKLMLENKTYQKLYEQDKKSN